MLREQLDQATSANQNLTSDIHRLTADWQRAREELEHKETEWREEVRAVTLNIVTFLSVTLNTVMF